MRDTSETNVLVIGANGFIGSHLVEVLRDLGFPVRAFDRYSEPPRFRVGPGVEIVAGDIQNHADLRGAIDGIDTVVHSLSFSTPASSEGDPTFDVRTNVISTVDLLDLCRRAAVPRFIYASSGGTVYGELEHAARETDIRRPISPYGIGKATIEDYLQFYGRQWDMRTISLRISNPYGVRQRSTRQGLISIVLRRALQGEPVTVLGDGGMVRDYIEVGDLAKMMAKIACARNPRHTVYNLGTGNGTSVNEILAIAEAASGTKIRTAHEAKPRGFVDFSVLDTNRFTREFGRQDLIDVRTGIDRLWLELTS